MIRVPIFVARSTTTFNPNWLYSTAAQSAAALVAIIGGLLISRLVALAVERQGLLRQIDAAVEELQNTRNSLDDYTDRVSRVARHRFIERKLKSLVAAQVSNIPDRAAQYIPPGATRAEVDHWTVSLLEQIRIAFDAIKKVMEPSETSISRKTLAQRGVPVQEFDEILPELIKRIERDTRPSFAVAVDASSALEAISSLSRTSMPDQHDANIRERDHLRAQFDLLRAQEFVLRNHLSGVSSTPDIRSGIFSLVAFSVLGIVYPMTLMAVQPIPSAGSYRASVIVAFILGLTLVIRFIYVFWKSLNPSDHKQDHI